MKMKKWIGMAALLVLVGVGSYILGFRVGGAGAGQTGEQAFRLHVVRADMDVAHTTASSEELLSDGFNVTYLGLSQVTVDTAGGSVPLEEALRNGAASIGQLLSQARRDAADGTCADLSESENGLTRFLYRYPEYDLLFIHDLYETPDGEQHLLSEFAVCAPERTALFLYTNDETGRPIDYEDWGLDVAVTEASAVQARITCTQAGGQQVGTLVVRDHTLYKASNGGSGEELVPPLAGDASAENQLDIPIQPNGQTSLTIPLAELYGALPEGDYILYLMVEDQYDEADLHPLARKFHDHQLYGAAFTVTAAN